ncbi:NADH pyrophosphatase [Serendipita sp. 411]|nr:NADH pyrophosphatase [Serendipita sp. 411]
MSDQSGTFTNFMAGSPLNRFGWLRTSAKFINASACSPRARWILFRSGDPLVHQSTGKLVELPTSQLGTVLGSQPYFGQGQLEGESALPEVKNLESARLRGPRAVFLGVWERDAAQSASGEANAKEGGNEATTTVDVEDVKGDFYFALDVSDVDKQLLETVQRDSLKTTMIQEESAETVEGQDATVNFVSSRAAADRLDGPYGAILAGARAMIEWNSRIKFCAGCGSPVYSIWAGWKLACSSFLPWAQPRDPPCPTRTGLHAHQYPRTDTVVITGVIDQTGDKMLLGWNVGIIYFTAAIQYLNFIHQRKFPGKYYSTLAGFVEPGESFEEAVFREIYEESGVKVYDAVYHSSQPWPYPGNLMVGFYARADSTQPISLDLDTELMDARWFTKSEILEILAHRDGTNWSARDHKKLDDIVSGNTDAGTSQSVVGNITKVSNSEPPFRVPPQSSIAGVLIAEWAYGKSKL